MRWLTAALLLLAFGGWMRLAMWRATAPVRYHKDAANGFYWGTEVLAEGERRGGGEWQKFARGYYGLYDSVQRMYWDGTYYLDYPPLRLAVAGLWAKWIRAHDPGAVEISPETTWPLRLFNAACELASALLAALLVGRGSPLRAGMVVALIWLNPALILDGHGWPQWDGWLLPWFLAAALAGQGRRWFGAGVCLGAGALFKGQLLMVAPFFLLWPLFFGHRRGTLAVAGGALVPAVVIGWPWLLPSWPAVIWSALLAGSAVWLARRTVCGRGGIALFAGTFAAAALVSAWLFGGSYAWFEIGYAYGARQYPLLFLGVTYNAGSLLAAAGFTMADSWLGVALPVLMKSGCLALLAVCAWAAARGRSGQLLALATVWVVCFALLPQMQERYLVWGAAATALAAGVSWRWLPMHLLTTALAFAMTLDVMLRAHQADGAGARWLASLDPGAGWLTLAVAAVLLAGTVRSGRRGSGIEI